MNAYADTLAKESTQDTKEEKILQLPHNIEAEQALLGSLLINNEYLNRIGDVLESMHFYAPVHQRIYQAILAHFDKGLVATPVTLKHQFDQDEALKESGKAGYLAKLIGFASTVRDIETIAQTIRDLYMRRELISIGQQLVTEALQAHDGLTAAQDIERAEQQLFMLANENISQRDIKSLRTSMIEVLKGVEHAFKTKEKITGLSTGYARLDGLLGGLQKSDLIILAGRPSTGKTAFGINVTYNVAKALYHNQVDGKLTGGVGVFSLEMSAEQLASRLLALSTGIDCANIRNGLIQQKDYTKIVEVSHLLSQLPFYIDDTPALSVSALRTRARRLKRKYDISLLLVDYLQLMRGSSKASERNRVQEVSEITQGLKAIAKELNIPVIAISQLSRAVEQREDKRPQLSDLRESGSIEQDADIVIFLYREEYYLSRKEPVVTETMDDNHPMVIKHKQWEEELSQVKNQAEIIIAKQRNGPIGNDFLYFNSRTTAFSMNDTEHEANPI